MPVPFFLTCNDPYVTADKLGASNIDSIHLLGFDGALTWNQISDGLEINLPSLQPASDYAFNVPVWGLFSRWTIWKDVFESVKLTIWVRSLKL
jgi:hypothetical protein